MTTYGNRIWLDATANSDKSIIEMSEKAFRELHERLDRSGINYYAYENGGAVRMAVNDKDIGWLKKLVGSSHLDMKKSAKEYTPPAKNIFGNAEFRYIPDKKYFKTDGDIALKIAEILDAEGVKFSGRIYDDGHGTLTVSEKDHQRVQEICDSVKEMRRQFVPPDRHRENDEIIGNTPLKNIQNRQFFISRRKPEDYYAVRDYMESQNVPYSGLIRDGKLMFTVDKDNAAEFFSALDRAESRRMVIADLAEMGMSAEQVKSLIPVIDSTLANDNALMLSHYVDPEYTDEQLADISEKFERYITQDSYTRLTDADKLGAALFETKSAYDTEVAIKHILGDKAYSDEQQTAIREAFAAGATQLLLEQLDPSYTADEIREYSRVLSESKGMREYYAFMDRHKEKMLAPEKSGEQRYASAQDMIKGFISKSMGYAVADKERFKGHFLISDTDDIIDSVARVMLSNGDNLSVNEAVKKLNDDPDLEIQYAIAQLSSPFDKGVVLYERLTAPQLSAIYDSTVYERNTSSPEYKRTLQMISERQGLQARADDIMKEYLGNYKYMPTIVDMDFARDELPEIAKSFAAASTNEERVAAAKSVLSDSSFSCTIPETDELDKRYFSYGVNGYVDMEKGEDGVTFSYKDFSVTYTWQQTADLIQTAADNFVSSELAWGKAHLSEKTHRPDPAREAEVIKAFAEVKARFEIPSHVEDFMQSAQSVIIANNLDSFDLDFFKSSIFTRRCGCVEKIDDEMGGRLGEIVSMVNERISHERAAEVAEEKPESTIQFGLLGNGVTVYDTARNDPEAHDYLTVAHISPEGNISFYDDKITDGDKMRIREQAEGVKRDFMAEWDKLPTSSKLSRLIESGSHLTEDEWKQFHADSSARHSGGLTTEELIEKYAHAFIFKDEPFPVTEQAAAVGDKRIIPELQSILNEFFVPDRYDMDEVSGEWRISSVDSDHIAEIYENEKAVCGLYNDVGGYRVEIYGDRTDVADTVLGVLEKVGIEVTNQRALTEGRSEKSELEIAKENISNFCDAEYGDKAEFGDLHKVSIAYTTVENGEGVTELQVYANLIDCALRYYVDNELYKEETYSDLHALNEDALSVLDFQQLYGEFDDVVQEIERENESMAQEHEQADYLSHFSIYQIKDGEEYRYNRFEPYSENEGKLNFTDYDLVYSGSAEGRLSEENLESLYNIFNTDERPPDFKGRSLSLSDVIVVEQDGEQTAYYVDRVGFTEMPDFFKEKVHESEKAEETTPEPAPQETVTEEKPKIANTLAHRNFVALQKMYTEIFSGEHSYEKYKSDIYEDFSIERYGDTLTMMHTFGQNGDLMYDPRIDYYIDFENQTLKPVNYEMSSLGIYHEYTDGSALQRDCSSFTATWIKNLQAQKRDLFRFSAEVEVDGEIEDVRVTFGEDGVPEVDGSDKGAAAFMAAHKDMFPEYEDPAENIRRISPNEISEGDMFMLNGREVTVTPKKGIYPDDVVISQIESLGGIEYEVNTNISRSKLAAEGEYIGNPERESKQAEQTTDTPEQAAEQPEDGALFNESALESLYNEAERDTDMSFGSGDNGVQLSFFGDDEPQPEKPKPTRSKAKAPHKDEYAEGLFVGGINRFTALTDEVIRHGTGFVDGKFRVEQFYKENKPTNKELAAFLKKEYGVGGHSADDPVSLVSHDSKGIEFSLNSGEKFKFTWSEVAEIVSANIDKGTYITQEDIDERISRSKRELDSPDYIKAEKARRILDEYGILPENDQPAANDTHAEKDTPAEAAPTAEESGEVKLKSIVIDLTPKAERTAEVKQAAPEQSEDFHITDDSLGEGGEKAKFRANIEAIKTLKRIESEKRTATPEEKETMSRYVGWGGLANAFNGKNERWAKEYAELKELLTPAEYESANSTVLDSFYTTPVVIDGIYKALEQFGFEGGRLLEPSCGVGNFIGRMPEEMARDTKVHAVEIDSISGRLAQAIYPNAEVSIRGFQQNEFQNGCFDVAVGNVPFGDLGFTDRQHGAKKLHDYFFLETLDKVKSGGIVAFITSTGTLDKKDSSVREKIAEQADLIGAVRLPSTAFKANANTEVTADIIFLQKRSEPPEVTPDWVQLGETKDGLSVNKYFEQHPEMILGKLVEGNKLYNRSSGTMCIADKDADLGERLTAAVKNLSAAISDEKAADVYDNASRNAVLPPVALRNFSFFEHDNKIYFKLSDRSCECRHDKSNSTMKRYKAFISLRDTTRELLSAQEQDKPDSEIKALQEKLNTLYDDYYKKYGLLHSRTNKRYFGEDSSFVLVAALEKSYDKEKLIAKSDIFTKRTIKPAKAVTHVDTAVEALTLSSAERARVDLDYMQWLTDIPKAQLIAELQGQIFRVPMGGDEEFQTASEYLSGDIRQKLKVAQLAAQTDSRFEENVQALEKAMPTPLKAGDIDIRIGAAWVDPKIYQQFIYECFETPQNLRADVKQSFFMRNKADPIEVSYCAQTETFGISRKGADTSVLARNTYGTKKMNAYEIMESLLNLKEPKVTKVITDPVDGKERRVVDMEATKLAQRKAKKIRAKFKDWIFKDPERRDALVERYNELFNGIRPREYDGSSLSFPGMNASITLHDHQKNAIAHALFGGNTLFAHSVGAGKSATRS